MKDAKHKVIYLGKAKNPKNQVRVIFRKAQTTDFTRNIWFERVADLDFVLTETEKEALILENNLIKQFKPKFNINLTMTRPL